MKILVVEDNVTLADAIGDYLQLHGYAFEHLRKIDGALNKMLHEQFMLFLLDVDLPDGSGLDLCQAYRLAGGRGPVIIMTGHDLLEDKETGLEAGADDYLTKPFALREMFARIKAVLRRSTEYSASPLAALKPDCTLGKRYKLIEQIGEGGMARIWLAKDLEAERLVVIKIMKEDFLEDTGAKRFESEIKLLARLNHPNVVALFDVGYLSEQIPYLVMEFIKGESLRDILDREKTLPPLCVLKILVQVCNGLQEAHEAGVVHRDLKPENILLQDRRDRRDAVKIVDFGIAQDMDGVQSRLTKTGMVVGTLDYLSPEQLSDRSVDGRADIYALGIIAYELLTGKVPFVARSSQSLVAKQLMEDAAAPSSINPALAIVDELIAGALQKKPVNRYQSAAQMRNVVEELITSLLAAEDGTL